MQPVVIFLEVVMETNKFKRAWIWFWYNDITRICILMGMPIIPVVFTVGFIFGFDEYLRGVAQTTVCKKRACSTFKQFGDTQWAIEH
jgi:hypothetical protein